MMQNSYYIEDLTDDEKGISKKDGLVYFIDNAKLDDTVTIKNIKDKKRFIEAEKDSVLKKSSFRIKSKCKFYEKCTGCTFQDLEYIKEKDFKKNKLINNLKRIGNIRDLDAKDIDLITLDENILNYRNKLTLKVKDNKLGYFKRQTNDIVEIDECVAANENINKVIKEFKNIDLKHVKEIVIRSIQDKMQIEIELKENCEIDNKIKEHFKNLENIKEVFEIYIKYKDKKNKVQRDILYKKENFVINFLDNKFKIRTDSFFQVNTNMAEKVYKDIKDEILKNEKSKSAILIDLYSGVGVSSIIFSDIFKKIVSIELNEEAIKDAKENVKLNNKENIEIIQGKAEEEILKLQIPEKSFVFVDPPRKGLTNEIIDKINESNVKDVIYMSCNSTTLARDLKRFRSYNYNIKQIKLYDMFPRTMHFESLVFISKD